ncbi:hypothetical protein AAHN97_16165 [Chitinophaga niabensis]|uniref:hypothetical protein n=1 Tax=Chitinophaga niabensis TaxID=536979 RepID=UPI0031BB88C8
MENIPSEEEAYAALYRRLCTCKRLSYIDWKKFMDRTNMVQFKMNDVFIKAGSLSTHSYFIIKGLVMCYEGQELKPEKIKWVRAEHDYAFTVDKFSFGEEKRMPNEYSLVALEDTLAFSLSHEDYLWLKTHCKGFDLLYMVLIHAYSIKIKKISNCVLTNDRDRYEWIQEVHGFKLERIPGVYLKHCIGVTEKRLKELQKNNRIDFLTRY